MALENKRPFIPNLPPKKEATVSPEKAAKKLYTDSMFTISKLSERAKRATREVDELTNTRLGDEQLHAFGTPSTAETAALQALTEKIQAKLKKAQEEVVAATEAYSKLDKDLSELGVLPDNPMRLNIKNKRELGSELLEKMSERIQSESSSHEQELRRQAVREALRPAEKPRPANVKKEKGPVTETLVRPEGGTFTAGEINEFSKLYDEAAREDLKGVITPEEVARRIQEATDRENPVDLSEVAPAYTAEELAARSENKMTSKLTPRTSGEGLVNVARSIHDYNVTKDHPSLSKLEAALPTTPVPENRMVINNRYQKEADRIANIQEKIKSGAITSMEQLVAQLQDKSTTAGFGEETLYDRLNTVVGKKGLQASVGNEKNGLYRRLTNFTGLIAGKKHVGGDRTADFALDPNKAMAFLEQQRKNAENEAPQDIQRSIELEEAANERASKSIDNGPVASEKNPKLSDRIKTFSGERSATVTRAPGEEFKVDTDVKKEAEEWNEMLTSAKMTSKESSDITEKNKAERAEAAEIEKTVNEYIEKGTPLLIKRTSGEMTSGCRARMQTADGRVLVSWEDPVGQTASNKYVRSEDLVSWQKEGVKAPTTKNYEKPRTVYEAAGKYLSSVQDQLKSGQISTTAQLEAALNRMESPSYQDLLSPQERYTTKISEAVSDRIHGLFTTKYEFNPDLAAAFVAKLNQNAKKTAETFHE